MGGSYELKDRAFQTFEIAWEPFGRDSEALVKAMRQAVGQEALLMEDAGGSDPFITPNLRSGRGYAAPYDLVSCGERTDGDDNLDFRRSSCLIG
jgi:hypothetical protein